jgi:hypothetical protein
LNNITSNQANVNKNDKKSPFKHKNKSNLIIYFLFIGRQTSNNFNNLRHLKNIESQLINLSDSIFKNSIYQGNNH